MGHNKFIQSVLARSIMDADFLRTLNNRTKKAEPGTEIFNNTLKGLKYFSGFIAKVQHNFLWNDFMLTRKMLIKQHIELEVFTAYLPEHHQNKKNKINSQAEKITRFITFLKNYLEQRSQKKYRLVYNVLLHEEAMYALKQEGDAFVAGANGKTTRKKMASRARPAICGAVRHVLMDVPPAQLGECFKKGNAALLKRRRYYCYWYDPHTPAVRILEIPVMMRRVLIAVDNKKKIKEIVQHCAPAVSPGNTQAVLEHLYQMKMISLN